MSYHFTWQSAVIKSDMTASEKLVLLVVGTYMNMHGSGAFPSYAQIASASSLSRRKVIEAIGRAEELGWLQKMPRERDNGSSSSNEYSVSFPPEGGEPGAPGSEYGAPGGEPGALGVVNTVHQGGEPGAPHITPQLTPQPNTPSNTLSSGADSKRKKGEYSPEFEEAWKAYPSRPGDSKAAAFKAWNARLKAGATAEQMMTGVRSYAAHCAAEKKEPRYVKQAATFFGPGEHFLADWTPKSVPRDERSRAHYDRSADTATMMRQIEKYNIQPYDGEF